MTDANINLESLNKQVSDLTERESVAFFSRQFEGEVAFVTNFGLEDQVITHLILIDNLPVEIFTIDTGRLFEETYQVWSKTNNRYKTVIKAYYPKYKSLQQFAAANGPDAIYTSKQLRKQCCFIRKTEPLQRALSGKSLLISGLRNEHLNEEMKREQLEWDEENGVIKFYPLLHWTTEQVNSFIYENKIPYHPLHNKGFVSIGCAPCTRAIKPGEDFAAAHWWWEKKITVEMKEDVYAF